MQEVRAQIIALARRLRERWKSLLAAGVGWRLVAVGVLAPLYAALLRVGMYGSGQTVLTDTDLAYFALSPIGGAGLFAIGVLTVAGVALELAWFVAILALPAESASPLTAAWLVAGRAKPILQTAARVVLHALMWLAPAAIAIAVGYTQLLSEFDINYYLSERPREFWIAGAIVALVAIYLVYAAWRMTVGWFLALPAVLLEGVAPKEAHAVSRERLRGHALRVFGWLVGWFLASTALSALATGLSAGAVLWLAPHWPTGLTWVAIGIGLALLVTIGLGVAANLLSTIAFAAILRHTHNRLGGADAVAHAASGHAFNPRITRLRMTAGATIALLGATTLGYLALGRLASEDRVEVIGHRGAPQAAPENTLAAFEAAIEQAADWVEIDVQETADGEVVVFHDSDFMKVAGDPRKIWDLDLADAQQIDIGSHFDPAFADQRVPTLAETLALASGHAGVLVELKYYGHEVDLERRVAAIVEGAGAEQRVAFMSLKRAGVEKMKAIRPDWRAGQLLSVAVGNEKKLTADFLAINASFATRSTIRKAHTEGREVYVWTVNDPVAMSSLISRGVDGLITDTPDIARQVLAERAEMPTLARLLIDLANQLKGR